MPRRKQPQQNETPEQREQRLQRMKERAALRRQSETPEQRMERLERDRYYYYARKAKETPEQQAERLRSERERNRTRRANENLQQYQERLRKNRERITLYRAAMRRNKSLQLQGETSEKDDDASSIVWNSLMTLHPIGSEASTSGFSFSATSSSHVSKSETRSILQSEKALSPSLTPNVPTEEGVPSSLCIVKMEIEDDGYNDIPAEESFIANLASSRQDNTPNNLTARVLPFIKTEISEEILPTIPELSTNAKPESISNKQSVEEFFKSVAQTVMQLPPYLIEETKIKVSSLVKEMTKRAVNEGCTNVKQFEL